jgi:hypothetical protein
MVAGEASSPREGRGARGATLTRALLLCGAVGDPLFVVVFLILGVTRPGYDPLRHPVSSFAIGERGWLQAANFLLVGASLVACATGLWRALPVGPGRLWGPLLIGLAGVGRVGAGVCITDPVFGYPPTRRSPWPSSRPAAACTAPSRCCSSSACPPPVSSSAADSPASGAGDGPATRCSAASGCWRPSSSQARASPRTRALWASPGPSSACRSRPASSGSCSSPPDRWAERPSDRRRAFATIGSPGRVGRCHASAVMSGARCRRRRVRPLDVTNQAGKPSADRDRRRGDDRPSSSGAVGRRSGGEGGRP